MTKRQIFCVEGSDPVGSAISPYFRLPLCLMLSHHLRMSFRALARQRGTSFINIFGLGLGIACFVLIGLTAFVTIGGKTWRAAMADPVKALRYE